MSRAYPSFVPRPVRAGNINGFARANVWTAAKNTTARELFLPEKVTLDLPPNEFIHDMREAVDDRRHEL